MKDNLVYVTVPVEETETHYSHGGIAPPYSSTLVLTAPADEMVAIERAFRVR